METTESNSCRERVVGQLEGRGVNGVQNFGGSSCETDERLGDTFGRTSYDRGHWAGHNLHSAGANGN